MTATGDSDENSTHDGDGDTNVNDVRHEGASFRPDPADPVTPGPVPDYPPEADPDQAGEVYAAEVPGEQTDPTRRLTGGDQPEDGSAATTDDGTTPGSVDPPD